MSENKPGALFSNRVLEVMRSSPQTVAQQMIRDRFEEPLMGWLVTSHADRGMVSFRWIGPAADIKAAQLRLAAAVGPHGFSLEPCEPPEDEMVWRVWPTVIHPDGSEVFAEPSIPSTIEIALTAEPVAGPGSIPDPAEWAPTPADGPIIDWKTEPPPESKSVADEVHDLLTEAGVPEHKSTLHRLQLLIDRNRENAKDAKDLAAITDTLQGLLGTHREGILGHVRELTCQGQWVNTRLGDIYFDKNAREAIVIANTTQPGGKLQAEILDNYRRVVATVEIDPQWCAENRERLLVRLRNDLLDPTHRTEIPF